MAGDVEAGPPSRAAGAEGEEADARQPRPAAGKVGAAARTSRRGLSGPGPGRGAACAPRSAGDGGRALRQLRRGGGRQR